LKNHTLKNFRRKIITECPSGFQWKKASLSRDVFSARRLEASQNNVVRPGDNIMKTFSSLMKKVILFVSDKFFPIWTWKMFVDLGSSQPECEPHGHPFKWQAHCLTHKHNTNLTELATNNHSFLLTLLTDNKLT
jgi:hypothetical protein